MNTDTAPEAQTAETEPTEWPAHIGEVQVAYKCEACEHVAESQGDDPLYECDDDGVFNGAEGNRCPTCNKFAARIGQACEECGEGPVEEVEAFHCEICDEWFEDGDQDEHLHDDDEDDDTEEAAAAGKPRKARKSPYPAPILTAVPAREVNVGALIPLPWDEGTRGGERAASGKGEPYRYVEVDEVVEEDGRVYFQHVDSSTRWTFHHVAAEETVEVVTGWDRPTGAYEINVLDLRLHHVVFTAPGEDWTQRRAFTEIRRDLRTGQVTAISRYAKNSEPTTWPGHTTLTVADTDPASMFGKPGWRVEWDRSFPGPLARDADNQVVDNPEYDPGLDKAMEARGYVTGRKVYVLDRVRPDSDRVPYLAYEGKTPKMAEEFMAFLREHGYEPTALVEETKTR